MQKYKAVSAASLDLAMKTKSLVQEPGVEYQAIKAYCKILLKLKNAEDVMINQLCTQMMEELIPIGVEAMKETLKEGDGGKCTCGRQGHE